MGARMLNLAPALEPQILGFVKGNWRESELEERQRKLQSGSIGEIETTGTKLE